MTQRFIAVPFKAQKADGLVEINGIAKFSSAGIVFEFESKFLGLFGSTVKEVRVGLDDILNVEFKKGFYKFFARIIIRLNSFATLSQLPNRDGKIKFKIKREDFELANEAVHLLKSAMNEPTDQLPPAQTPVAELFDGSEDKYVTKELKETHKLD